MSKIKYFAYSESEIRNILKRSNQHGSRYLYFIEVQKITKIKKC